MPGTCSMHPGRTVVASPRPVSRTNNALTAKAHDWVVHHVIPAVRPMTGFGQKRRPMAAESGGRGSLAGQKIVHFTMPNRRRSPRLSVYVNGVVAALAVKLATMPSKML